MDRVVSTPLTAASLKAVVPKQQLTIAFAASTPEFRKLKIVIAARLAGIPLSVTTDLVEDSFLRTCVLQTKEGPITQSYAVLRYIGSGLYGATLFDEAQVDQWLEFCVLELEVAVLVVLEHGAAPAAKSDVQKALGVLDKVLESRTFLVGDSITIADIALTCVVKAALDLKLVDDILHFKNAIRWYLTCARAFEKELGPDTVVTPLLPKPKAPVTKAPVEAPVTKAVTKAKEPAELFTPQFARSRMRVKEVLRDSAVGSSVTVQGWVRSVREADKGSTRFAEVNDGSCLASIQVVATKDTENFDDLKACGGAGASLEATGIIVESMGKGQKIEMKAVKIKILGATRGQNYPLAKKFHTPEHLRLHAHLRPRSRLGGAVVRIRHALAFATHEFFNSLGFLYVHTPLITAADCEGAGEQFTVTTLLEEDGAVIATNGKVDYSKDFFGKRTGLTVSGQLNVETHAIALSDCYTFGPTFRAENSHTARHLAEFWMIEPEVSFATLDDDIALASDYLKYCVAAVLCRCDEDLAFFEQANEKGLRDRLKDIVDKPFKRLEYTEAISILQEHIKNGHKFENNDVVWGMDLNSEHEKYLTEIYQGPVVLVNYPKDIKAFYMKLNGETVAAMDILVPKIGEIIGGSQREDSLEVLEARAKEVGIEPSSISWYADLRKYGSVPHAGFGLGFERLVMLVTGVENIRDVIPFPRYPGHAAF